MNNKSVPDFAIHVPRETTDAAKFAARKSVFKNESVQPLWVADMDLAAPPFLQESLHRRIAHPCYGYTVQSTQLKTSIKWWMEQEHALKIDLSAISFSPSVVTSISNAIAAFTGSGEGVALFSPVYERFYSTIRYNQRNVVNIPLLPDRGRYYIDFASFRKACAGGRVRLLLLCNPQNPSGRVWTRAELTELVQICNEFDVFLFSDEIHSDIVFPPEQHTSILSVQEIGPKTLVAHSIGKTFNTSGLEGSFVLLPDTDQHRLFQTQANTTHTADINLLAKTAIRTLFSENGQTYKKKLIAYLQKNRDILAECISSINSLSLMCPESTFLAWINFQKTGLSHDEIMKKLIFEAQLGLNSGLLYGPTGKKWFRLNFAVSKIMLKKALDKLDTTFQ